MTKYKEINSCDTEELAQNKQVLKVDLKEILYTPLVYSESVGSINTFLAKISDEVLKDCDFTGSMSRITSALSVLENINIPKFSGFEECVRIIDLKYTTENLNKCVGWALDKSLSIDLISIIYDYNFIPEELPSYNSIFELFEPQESRGEPQEAVIILGVEFEEQALIE